MTRSRRTKAGLSSSARRTVALLAALVASAALAPVAARAADGAYVAYFDHSLAFLGLNDSGGMNLLTDGATVTNPTGVTIDPAHGRVYWIEPNGPDSIWWANVDGSGHGGGPLNVAGATVSGPIGLAIDPTVKPAGRIYWLNSQFSAGNPTGISFANLDGSGGGNLNVGSLPMDLPTAFAVDPVKQLAYWANSRSNTIAFVHLNGDGGGDLVKTGSEPVSSPLAITIDRAANRVYWVNSAATNTISWADLSNTGAASDVGGHVFTDPLTLDYGGGPGGLAVDHAADRIYWRTFFSVAYSPLEGNGQAHELNTSGASGRNNVSFVVSVAPRPLGPPVVTGASTAGGTLSCSSGSWAPDLVEASLYAAPTSFAYQWSRDGADLPGATAPTLTAPTAGGYACRVTAVNAAGTAVQTSEAHAVSPAPSPPAFGASTRASLRSSRAACRRAGRLRCGCERQRLRDRRHAGGADGQAGRRCAPASREAAHAADLRPCA